MSRHGGPFKTYNRELSWRIEWELITAKLLKSCPDSEAVIAEKLAIANEKQQELKILYQDGRVKNASVD